MPMRSTNAAGGDGGVVPRAMGGRFYRALARHGIKLSIIVAGTAVAATTLSNTTAYLPGTSLVHRLMAGGSAIAGRPSTLAKAASDLSPAKSLGATSIVARAGGLDRGIQHERIDVWVKRLSTSLSAGFETALGRKDKYSGMIGAKLAAK